MTSRPSARMLPQLGCGAGTPTPRKLRDASVMMASAKLKEACTTTAGRMFGAMCLQMMRKDEAPWERSASM